MKLNISRFICEHILRREFPLVRIADVSVPNEGGILPTISLGFSKDKMKDFGINEENVADATAEIITHEFLHYLIEHLHSWGASWNLNLINRWDAKNRKMEWMLWAKGEPRYVWESI